MTATNINKLLHQFSGKYLTILNKYKNQSKNKSIDQISVWPSENAAKESNTVPFQNAE